MLIDVLFGVSQAGSPLPSIKVPAESPFDLKPAHDGGVEFLRLHPGHGTEIVHRREEFPVGDRMDLDPVAAAEGGQDIRNVARLVVLAPFRWFSTTGDQSMSTCS